MAQEASAQVARLEREAFLLQAQLDTEKAKVVERDIAYNAAAQEFELQQGRWRDEEAQLRAKITQLQEDVKKSGQDRARCQQLSADLASRDRQIEALRSTIQQVDVQKQNLEATIASKEQLLNARLAQIEQLSAANTQLQSQLDGMQVHVQRSRDSADINVLRAQLEQEKQASSAEIAFLKQQLEESRQSLMESRRASSAEHATLRHELEATKYSLVAAEEREKAARERVQKVEEFLTQARSATTSAETRLREAEEHFAKQEARLQTLLQEASTARSAAEKEAGELRAREDRIRQDMEQIQRIHAASQASSQEAQAARERALNAAKAQLAALREAVDSVLTTGDLPALAAFVNAGGNPGVNSPGAGQLSVPSTPAAPSTAAIERAAGYVRGQPQQQAGAGPSWRLTFGTPGPGAVVPATPEALTPGTGLSKSAAELYKMYMQMSEAWHNERSRCRKLESYLEQIAVEAEAKSEQAARSREMHATLEAAHRLLQESVSTLKAQVAQLEQRSDQQRADALRAKREADALEQTIQDQQKQMATLVAEVQRLQGKPLSTNDGAQAGPSAEQLLTATTVISTQLVSFKTVAELLEQNRRLLSTSRSLAGDLERTRAEHKEEAASEFGTEIAHLKQELATKDGLIMQLNEACMRAHDKISGQQAELASLRGQLAQGGGGVAGHIAGPSSGPNSGRALALPSPRGNGGAIAGDVAAYEEEIQRLNKELDQARRETLERVTELQGQVTELRLTHSAAVSQGRLAVQRAETAEQRVRELLSEQQHERNTLQAVNRAKDQADSLAQRLHEELQKLRTRNDESEKMLDVQRQRVVMLESQVSHLKMIIEQHNTTMSLRDAELTRAKVEAMTAQKLHETTEARLRAAEGAHQSEVQGLKASLETLRSDMSRQADNAHAAAMADKERVDRLTNELKALQKANMDLNAALSEARKQLADAQTQVTNLQRTAEQLGEQLAARAQADGGEELIGVSRLREAEASLREATQERDAAKEDAEERQKQLDMLRGLLSTFETDMAQLESTRASEKERAEQDMAALRTALEERESTVRSLQQSVELKDQSLQQALGQLRDNENRYRMEVNRLTTDCNVLRGQLASKDDQISSMQAMVDPLRSQVQDYRDRFENELAMHVKDIQALKDTERALSEQQREVLALRTRLAGTQADARHDIGEASTSRTRMAQELQAAQAKVQELEAETSRMQSELRRILGETIPETTSLTSQQWQELKDFLLRDRATFQAQLTVLTEERARMKIERDEAVEQTSKLNGQIENLQKLVLDGDKALQERVNTLVAEAEVRAKVLGQVQGNLSLAEASHRDLTQRLAQRDQELAALKTTVNELRAELAGKSTELESVKRGEQYWQSQYNSLIARSGNVTLEDLERAKQELSTAQEELSATKQRVQTLESEKGQVLAQLAGAQDHLNMLRSVSDARDKKLKNEERLKAELQAKISELEAANRQLQDRPQGPAARHARELQARVEAAERAQAELETAKTLAEDRVKKLNSMGIKFKKEKEAAVAELATAQKEISRLQQELASATKQMQKLQSDLAASKAAAAASKQPAKPAAPAAVATPAAAAAATPPATARATEPAASPGRQSRSGAAPAQQAAAAAAPAAAQPATQAAAADAAGKQPVGPRPTQAPPAAKRQAVANTANGRPARVPILPPGSEAAPAPASPTAARTAAAQPAAAPSPGKAAPAAAAAPAAKPPAQPTQQPAAPAEDAVMQDAAAVAEKPAEPAAAAAAPAAAAPEAAAPMAVDNQEPAKTAAPPAAAAQEEAEDGGDGEGDGEGGAMDVDEGAAAAGDAADAAAATQEDGELVDAGDGGDDTQPAAAAAGDDGEDARLTQAPSIEPPAEDTADKAAAAAAAQPTAADVITLDDNQPDDAAGAAAAAGQAADEPDAGGAAGTVEYIKIEDDDQGEGDDGEGLGDDDMGGVGGGEEGVGDDGDDGQGSEGQGEQEGENDNDHDTMNDDGDGQGGGSQDAENENEGDNNEGGGSENESESDSEEDEAMLALKRQAMATVNVARTPPQPGASGGTLNTRPTRTSEPGPPTGGAGGAPTGDEGGAGGDEAEGGEGEEDLLAGENDQDNMGTQDVGGDDDGGDAKDSVRSPKAAPTSAGGASSPHGTSPEPQAAQPGGAAQGGAGPARAGSLTAGRGAAAMASSGAAPGTSAGAAAGTSTAPPGGKRQRQRIAFAPQPRKTAAPGAGEHRSPDAEGGGAAGPSGSLAAAGPLSAPPQQGPTHHGGQQHGGGRGGRGGRGPGRGGRGRGRGPPPQG